jgi:integrase
LSIRHGKTGSRSVTLSTEGIAFFKRITAKHPAAAVLLPRPDGARWQKSEQARPFKRAAALAELPPSASFYSLRHSHVSRAIENNMPMVVLAENLGTSVAMIEKTYAHLFAEKRRELVQEYAPRLRRVK